MRSHVAFICSHALAKGTDYWKRQDRQADLCIYDAGKQTHQSHTVQVQGPHPGAKEIHTNLLSRHFHLRGTRGI